MTDVCEILEKGIQVQIDLFVSYYAELEGSKNESFGLVSKLSDQASYNVDVIREASQPHMCPLGCGIDLPHDSHLLTSFVKIELINAQLVDP